MATNGTSSMSSFFVSESTSLSPTSSPTIVSPDPSTAGPSSSAPASASSEPPPASTDMSSSADAALTSSALPAPSSAPVQVPSSAPPASTSEPAPASSAPASSAPASSASPSPASSAPAPASSSAPPVSTSKAAPLPATSTIIAPSAPATTVVSTKIVTPTATKDGETATPETILVTIIGSPTDAPLASQDVPLPSSSADAGQTSLQNNDKTQTKPGLSTGGKTAIAVVVPIVVVALLLLAGILLWRKRKQRKNAEEARRKEVEEYGFNPNHEPALPAVGVASEMAEDQSGYRGWGNTQGSNRKQSTTLGSGMAYSDSTSNPGGGPSSPTQAQSDSQSNDPLVNGRRSTMDSEGIGALGAAPNANQNQSSVQRGPSNASSSYSAANHSDNSGDYPIPMSNSAEYYDTNAGYYQSNPYNNGYPAGQQQPVIRDVLARRNTRIESPTVFPQQGNSGIAQNF